MPKITTSPSAIAFRLLHEYATEIKESCAVGRKQWACGDCPSFLCQRARYDEVIAAAKALTKSQSK
jgi:hypothetical protein